MTSDVATDCSVEGVQFLDPDLDESRACELFQEHLDKALIDSGLEKQRDAYSVAIVIGKRGSLQAQIVERGADEATSNYPVVAIDVMDRPLRRDDLGQLAGAVASVLTEK